MLVCCHSPWHGKGEIVELEGIKFLFNEFSSRADIALDIKAPRTGLSRRFPPERRVWVHIEPIRFTAYFPGFERYYQGGVLSWHSGLECLPQLRRYRGCTFPEEARDIESGKTFGIGGHISPKYNAGMEGYRLRHELLQRQWEISIPSLVFNHQGQWLGKPHHYPREGTAEVMHYMFHLAVENSRERRYFTEKLIRAFANMTVPVYFGDPDIGDEFDIDGIILIDEDNWLDVINALSPADYFDRLEVMKNNYRLSQKYWGQLDQIAVSLRNCPAFAHPRHRGRGFTEAIPALSPGVEYFHKKGSLIIYRPDDFDRHVKCNESAEAVFSLMDGHRTVGDIAAVIGRALGMPDTTALLPDVSEVISKLFERELIAYVPTAGAVELYPVTRSGWELETSPDGPRLQSGTASLPLSESSARVWSLCDGSRTIETIVELVGRECQKRLRTVARDVHHAVFRLADKGALDVRARARAG